MIQQARRRDRRAIALVALVLSTALAFSSAGCGSTTAGTAGVAGDAAETGSTDVDASAALSDLTSALSAASSLASQAAPDSSGGTATITVNGETTEVTLDPCVIIDTTDVNLSLYSPSSGLDVMLPPEPGPFEEGDIGRALLPPPSDQDEYRPTTKLIGQWTKEGSGASGHIEGTANLLSGLTSDDDPDIPFSIDFDCASVDDLTAQ